MVACTATLVTALFVLTLGQAAAFDGVHKRIDDTHKRIDDTNERIDDTNERIDDTNERITSLEARMDARFDRLEALMHAVMLGGSPTNPRPNPEAKTDKPSNQRPGGQTAE